MNLLIQWRIKDKPEEGWKPHSRVDSACASGVVNRWNLWDHFFEYRIADGSDTSTISDDASAVGSEPKKSVGYSFIPGQKRGVAARRNKPVLPRKRVARDPQSDGQEDHPS